MNEMNEEMKNEDSIVVGWKMHAVQKLMLGLVV